MPIHDLYCPQDKHILVDIRVESNSIKDGVTERTCPECGGALHVYFGGWHELPLEDHGRLRSERTDHNGFIKNFTAADDPICQIELGLHRKVTDKSLQTFTPDQVDSFRALGAVDGDSPKFRRRILEMREENIRRKYRK